MNIHKYCKLLRTRDGNFRVGAVNDAQEGKVVLQYDLSCRLPHVLKTSIHYVRRLIMIYRVEESSLDPAYFVEND